MDTIRLNEVKEKLLRGDSFSVFIYLKDGEFVADAELKKGCIGVFSTDIASILDDSIGDVNAFDFVETKEKAVLEMQKPKDEVAEVTVSVEPEETDEYDKAVEAFVEEHGKDKYLIRVVNEDVAKKFLEPEKVRNTLLSILSEMIVNMGDTKTKIMDTHDFSMDLGFDSLDEMDFWMRIEFQFGITVENVVLERLFASSKKHRTVRFLAKFIVHELKRVLGDKN